MIKIFGYDLKRLFPAILALLGLAFFLPYFTHLLYIIFPTTIYDTLAHLTFYAVGFYVLGKEVLSSNFSKIFGKEAYFYRTIPISNIKLLVEKYVLSLLGVIWFIFSLICLEVNSSVIKIWSAGIPLKYAYSGQLSEFNSNIVKIGFLVAVIVVAGFLAQAFCAGQIGICGFIERFNTKTVYFVSAIFWWGINQIVYFLCAFYIPGVSVVDKNGNFQALQMRFLSGNEEVPVVGVGVAMLIILLIPITVCLILGRKQVNLR